MKKPRTKEDSAKHTARMKQWRQANYAKRFVNEYGELVAPVSEEKHGRANTYNAHGCRCARCTAENADQQRRVKRRLRGRGSPNESL